MAKRDPAALKRALKRAWGAFRAPHAADDGSPFQYPIYLEYEVKPTPRYGYGKPAHPQLEELIGRNRESYAELLKRFLTYKDDLLKIDLDAKRPEDPRWHDVWFQGLDAVALYSMIALNDPARYIEIGSGSSTKFVRRAIRDHGLRTHVTSIDPNPRHEVDGLCDRIVRSPLEEVDLSVFDALEPGDVFFLDGSHRVFTNNDVVVAFLEVLPKLRPGVIVHIHDIFLPWDYPPQFEKLYYAEQYMLATHLLAKGDEVDIILPNFYVSVTPELHHVLDPLWDRFTWSGTVTNGLSFWFRA
jgi:predicted O-methyltransferase YrrM